MEIVIKIPKESYKATCNGCMLPPDVENVVNAIKNGKPLPKGHGDLIDRGTYYSALEEKIENWDVTSKKVHDRIHGISIAYNICDKLIPIIEADKAESEDKE